MSTDTPGHGGMGGGMGDRRRDPDDTVRVRADKRTDIHDSFRDRARGQLDSMQKITANSLETLWLAELRKTDDAEREKRRGNGRD